MNKKKIEKFAAVMMIGTITLGMLLGCGKSETAGSPGGVKILYTAGANDDPFRTSLSNAIESSAQSNGVTIETKLCDNKMQKQVEDVKQAKANGYSAIIIRPVDPSTALQLEVAADGLPIVFLNNMPDKSRLTANKYIYVGSNEEQAGKYQAEYVLKKLGNPSTMNVVILEGEKGHSGTIGRTAAVKNTLKDAGVKANYVFIDYANWSDTEAETKMNLFFKTGQSCDAIFSNNDTMALGACKALKDQGMDPASIPVTGVDATADGCASIAAGEMAFTVFQDADGQGKAAVAAAAALGKGKTISAVKGATEDGMFVWVPFVPVDASNVSQYQQK